MSPRLAVVVGVLLGSVVGGLVWWGDPLWERWSGGREAQPSAAEDSTGANPEPGWEAVEIAPWPRERKSLAGSLIPLGGTRSSTGPANIVSPSPSPSPTPSPGRPDARGEKTLPLGPSGPAAGGTGRSGATNPGGPTRRL